MSVHLQASVLVVDDNAAVRESLVRILKGEGYKTIGAEDGRAALELLRQRQVNLILTDLKMPNMDGLQLLRTVKMRFPEIKVILMTASVKVDMADEAIREGAYHFMQKPLKRLEILMVLARALEK